ncbi:MAG: hypothetical protein COA86_03225 [Kangiella sp.]|nr:MAG: hypothetical protein COA86_03225 [Kangiella sp.]
MKNSISKISTVVSLAILSITNNVDAENYPGSSESINVFNANEIRTKNVISTFNSNSIANKNLVNAEKNMAGEFDATIFTFNDITVFSYFDGTEITITDASGVEVASYVLSTNEQITTTLSEGIYNISGNQSYTTLVGDAISSAVQGFYAVDQSGRGLSTLLNTYMVNTAFSGEKFIVFGYSDNTSITIKNLETDDVIHAGIINKSEHFELPNPPFGTFLQVSSDKPVSALSYGDQDYYVPSDNGTFTGQLFYGYSGYIGGWTNSITITAYSDNTTGTIINSDSGEEIASFSLSEGQVYSHPINEPTYWEVDSDKNLTVANIPFSGWTGNYAYMTRSIDESGFGVGTEFYVPTIASKIDIFSFGDTNKVRVTKLGEYEIFPYESSETVTIDGKTLDEDGYFDLTSNEVASFNSSTGRFVYKVESLEPVSVLQSNSAAGSDFMPLNFALNLPDLAVSADKIEFIPQMDSYIEGDEIDISITIENVGHEVANDIDIFVYDGKPGDGIVPNISKLFISTIESNGSQTVTFKYKVPSEPEYRSLFVSIDPSSNVIESNPSNNLIERSVTLRSDLQLPLSVHIDAPGGLNLDGDVVTSESFEIKLDLFNLGGVIAEDLTVTLQLLDGLSLVEGENGSVSLNELQTNGKLSAIWKVIADSSVSGPNRYEIAVESSVSNKIVRRLVNVPDVNAPSIPTSTTAVENSNGSVSIAWQSGSERDLIGFVVYKKIGANFEELEIVLGASISSYEIANPDTSVSSYGIGSLDSSNNISDIVEITVDKFQAPTTPDTDNGSGGGALSIFLLMLLGIKGYVRLTLK